MKAAEGKFGRIFVIRLEDGDIVPACLEEFAQKKNIKVGLVTMIGGLGAGDVVVGPRRRMYCRPIRCLCRWKGLTKWWAQV